MLLAEQIDLPLPATVTIPKADYEVLVAASDFLDALQACGVDNWDGYGDAQEMMAADQ